VITVDPKGKIVLSDQGQSIDGEVAPKATTSPKGVDQLSLAKGCHSSAKKFYVVSYVIF